MVECTFSGPQDLTPEEQLIRTPRKWKLFVDGSVAGKICGADLILSSFEGFEICQAIRFDFSLTNNEAEYEALLAGMELARSLEAKHLRAFSDSMLRFSSVAHPQGNGAIEVANKIIFPGIKKRLGETKGRWSEELSWILWAYQTTPKSSIGETHFRMAYRMEALITVEVGLESYQTEVYSVETNNFRLRANMDFLEEEREAAHQRNMKYLLQEAQHYDSGIKKRSFGVGDLVLRELAASIPAKQGKLRPN
ncbi:uncharacterized protein LOC141691707 [Apium graveolens]|uniref:uncharacterized protein LOC141691707 n=1 Tax=Apium graveolens TaxID=4045 RepID=UPI003D7B0BF4